jgi:hypothetical protein
MKEKDLCFLEKVKKQYRRTKGYTDITKTEICTEIKVKNTNEINT